ncbi:MAG: biotin--[acetyl-CoA-carboxylase] ligase [Flavipsychrobacter sp.]|nr:biotin--[acetyl-CoA-carboxylase] ligase [Flavipsychrobacter sp.]
MQLIDADKALPGMTIVAQSQTEGKGQRGKSWVDTPGESLLMSVVTAPGRPITDQFVFNSSVAVSIANVLQKLDNNWDVHIKWPNDIIINDKKAGGILIENILRGSRWGHSVIGLGLNIKQEKFPPDLPYATSLKIASGRDFDVTAVRDALRESIITTTSNPLIALDMKEYNQLLFKRGKKQRFSNAGGKWDATILSTLANGTLEVQLEDGTIVYYQHGQVLWDWA